MRILRLKRDTDMGVPGNTALHGLVAAFLVAESAVWMPIPGLSLIATAHRA
jgi:hypothetical protein